MKLLKILFVVFLSILSILLGILLILVLDSISYDENHINVVHQTVLIEGLPPEFDGFTILQITDLHGERFGDSEQGLTGIINSLDYDLIAFTGDMQDAGSKDFQPFLEIIRGINRKTPMYFISGNTGPSDIHYTTSGDRYSLDMSDGIVLEAGKTLQRAGCTLLTQPQMIERGGARLWFATDFSQSQSNLVVKQIQQRLPHIVKQSTKDALIKKIEYQEKLQEIYATIRPSDSLIGIFHIPLSYKTLEDPQGLPPYDLVLAGHYHGGQIRLPYMGAIYIPDHTLPLYGLFPPQDLVSGLFVGNGIQQYVSRGVGASQHIPFLAFRLFDTPEIDLITLRTNK